MSKIQIGTNRGVLYSQKRFILDTPYKNFFVKREWDANTVLNAFYFRIYKRTNTKLFYTHSNINFSKAQIFHFFNAVSKSKRPWVTTLETPFTAFMRNGFDPYRYVAREQCKQIICMSHFTYKNTLAKINDNQLRDLVAGKLRILQPPQKLLVQSPVMDKGTGPLKFALVGNEFFRKGGKEVLIVFDRLLTEGYNIELHIVSTLQLGDFPVQTPAFEKEEVLKIINKHPQIIYHGSLPNTETLNIIRSCQIGLLPSFLETYGYTILEYMAAGLPILTTNQRAFLEVNNPERGWFAELPAENGYLIRDTEEKRKALSEKLTGSLYHLIREISGMAKEQLLAKSANAISYIRNHHDPDKYAAALEDIYFRALNITPN